MESNIRQSTGVSNGHSQGQGQSQQQNYGMTSAISLKEPTAYDIKLTQDLESVLRPHGMFESRQELHHRIEILGKLDRLVKNWVKEVSVQKGMLPGVAETIGGKIYTFGSYRLGVHSKGADIDTLCVVPWNIDRFDFFSSFAEVLRQQPEVADLRAVEEAFVPVIKMMFDNIEIDLTVARLALTEIPDDLELTADQLLQNLDPKCILSLNGCRVTDEILRQVPNIDNFRLALRAVKLWAKNHGIYSNVLGYFGGVTWAMLVARTCQLYPNAAAATIVHKFFLVFSMWPWPKPVFLKLPKSVDFGHRVWDPRRNPADGYHLMPIITPAYPHQNSTYNCSRSCKQIIEQELKEGLKISEEIFMKKASWEKLFITPNFFSNYRHYIALTASSNSEEDQLKWYGVVESRLRFLILNLERNQYIQLTHIWPKSYQPVNPIPDKFTTTWFIGLQFGKCDGLSVDLTSDIRNFKETILVYQKGKNWFKEGMEVEAFYVRRKDLHLYLPLSVLGKNIKKDDGNRKRKKSNSEDTENKKPRFDEANSSFDDSNLEESCNSQDTANCSDLQLVNDSVSEDPPVVVASNDSENIIAAEDTFNIESEEDVTAYNSMVPFDMELYLDP